MTFPLFIGGLGPPELLLIAGVLILLFGASKLPKLARSVGTATGEFKKGREEVEEELEEIREREEDDGTAKADESVDETTAAAVETESKTSADLESEPDPEQSGV